MEAALAAAMTLLGNLFGTITAAITRHDKELADLKARVDAHDQQLEHATLAPIQKGP